MKKYILFGFFAFLLTSPETIAQSNPAKSESPSEKAPSTYKAEIVKWRTEQETKLRSENNWLSVVGLAWLKPGDNSVGSGDDNQVRMPASISKNLGNFNLSGDQVFLELITAEGVTVNGEKSEAAKPYPLVADTEGKATEVKSGPVTFFMIKRKNGYGVRIKDSTSVARQNFKGRQWYDVDEKLKIEAKFVPFPKPKKIIVPDVLGNDNLEESPGYVQFKLNGKSYKLTPTMEENELFFVFKDKSCGKESYAAARFLYAEAAKDGKVILDFNKTVNPPCAFTDFATCPLPPKSNLLTAAILAGEKKPLESRH